MNRTSNSSRIVRRIVCLVAVAAIVASCGDDDDSSSDTTAATSTTTSTGSDDVCADREALGSSVAALQDVDVRAEGTDGVTAALTDIKDDLTSVQASAGDEVRPQVEAVQDGIEQVESAVDDFDSGGAAPVLAGVAEVAGSASTLLDSLEDAPCE
jgi:hypothetical protein